MRLSAVHNNYPVKVLPLLLLALLALLSGGIPLFSLPGLSVSSLEAEMYEDGDLRFTLEETILLRFAPRFSILSRVHHIGQEGWSKTSLSLGPVVVFAPGIYGELLYTLGVSENLYDHGASMELYREEAGSIISLGVRAVAVDGGADYLLASSGIQLYPGALFSPGGKYFITFQETGEVDHSLWLYGVLNPLPGWQFTPSFTPAWENAAGSYRFAFTAGLSARWQIRPLLSLTSRYEYRSPALGRSSSALMVLADLRW